VRAGEAWRDVGLQSEPGASACGYAAVKLTVNDPRFLKHDPARLARLKDARKSPEVLPPIARAGEGATAQPCRGVLGGRPLKVGALRRRAPAPATDN
jgi:hypothetical protein